MATYGEWRLKQAAAAGAAPEADGGGLTATRLLRDVPVLGTERSRKACKQKAPGAEAQSAALDLAAFPSLEGESPVFRAKRLAAYRRCWSEIKQEVEEELSRSHAGVFEQVGQFVYTEAVRMAAVRAGVQSKSTLRTAQVPMGLVFAGNVALGDHSQTYVQLSERLREQGAHVARLLPSALQKGCEPRVALQSLMQQFAQLSGDCGNDMAALLAWRRDSMAGAPEAAAVPWVVILEDAESADPACLGTLILLLSDAHHELPVLLIAGMATSVDALDHLVPGEAYARLRFRVFRLPPAIQRFETIVRHTLLGGKRPLMLHSSVCSAIDTYFQCHDFTTGSIMRSLQVALISHFTSEPLSMLAASATDGAAELEKEISEVAAGAPQLLAYGRVEVCPDVPREAPDRDIVRGITDGLLAVQSAYRGWAVVLRWLSAAAGILTRAGVSGFHAGFGIKDLFRVGSFPSYYAPGGQGAAVVARMAVELRILAAEEAREVLPLWLSAAEEVHGGAAAMGELLTEARELLEYDETAPAGEEGPSGSDAEPKGGREAAAAAREPEAGVTRAKLGNTRVQQRVRSVNRKSQMAAAVAAATAAKGGGDRASRERSPKRVPRLGERAAELLQRAVGRFLAASPFTLPGAHVFLCTEAPRGLMGAPRATAHTALSDPTRYMASVLPAEASGSVTAVLEHDTCLAYQILLTAGEFLNVVDWFTSFAAAVEQRAWGDASALPPALGRGQAEEGGQDGEGDGEGARGAEEAEDAAAAPSSGRVRSRGQGRGKQAQSGPPPSEPTAKRRPGQAAPQAAARGVGLGKEQQLEVAARFTQATSELQLLGYIKPARRGRQEAAQRLIFPTAIR